MSPSDRTIEIKVSAKTSCNALGMSIVAAYNEGKEIVLSAIGPVPVSQAMKAVCVANRSLASKGIVLCIIPGLITRVIFDKHSSQEMPWVIAIMRLRNVLEGVLKDDEIEDVLTLAENQPGVTE